MLFDNNLSTFGDAKTDDVFEQGDWFYEIVFNEGTTIAPVKFAVYPRLGTGNKPTEEFVDRLNGVKFQGSSDETAWVDLTAELTGIGK